MNRESTDFGIEIIESDAGNDSIKSPSSFKPTDVSGLQLWLDAADLTSLTYNPITTPIPSTANMLKRQAFSNGNQPNGGVSTTTNNVINTTTRHVVSTSSTVWSSIRLHYANFYNSFSMINNKFIVATSTATLTIKVSIQVGGTLYPGSTTLTLAGGQTGYIDVPVVNFTAGTVFYVHTNATKPAGSSNYPTNTRIRNNPVFDVGSVQGTNSAIDISAVGIPYGASATATVSGGVITALNLVSGGSGFTTNASVYAYEIQPNGVLGTKLVGTATVSGGTVTSLTLTDGTADNGIVPWVNPALNIVYGGGIITLSANNNANGYGPSIVTAIPDRPSRSVLGFGDSIMRGSQGTTIGDINGNNGNFEVAVGNRIGFINAGINGIRAYDFTDNAANLTDYWYNFYAPFATDTMVNLGINDAAWPLADDANDCINSLKDIGVKLRAFGHLVSFTTITPRAASSSDQYTTLANQVPQTWLSGTIIYNDFAATVNAAVKNGTIPSDNNIIDFAQLLVDPVETTKWRVSDGYKTNDGLHPTDSISSTRLQNGIAISSMDVKFKSYFNYSLALGGGYLAKWADKSGNNRHLLQSTSTSQPTTSSRTLNNLNIVYFDGNSDAMLSNPFPMVAQPLTHFIVMKFDKFGSDVYAIDGTTPTNDRLILRAVNGTYQIGSPTLQPTLPTSMNPEIHAIKYSTTDSKHWIGSGLSATVGASTGAGGLRGISIGGERGLVPVVSPAEGYYAEIITYSGELSVYDMNRIGNYLAKKWGLIWTNIPS